MNVQDIGPVALSIGLAIIIVAVMAMILSQMAPQTYVEIPIVNDSFSHSTLAGVGANATNVTLTTVGYGMKSGTLIVRWYSNTTLNTTTLTTGNYTLLSGINGIVEVEAISAWNTSGDKIDFSYTYDDAGASTSTITAGLSALSVFGDWFGIIVIVAVAAIILGLVMLFRASASGST
jgi:hypothetical protein